MEKLGLKQVDILNNAQYYCKAYNIKLSKSDLSQYVSGKVTMPTQDKLFILACSLNVSEAWLMGFDVPMERTSNAIERLELSLAEKIHIKKYRALDEHGKNIIDTILDIEYNRCFVVPAETEKTPTIKIKHSEYKVSAGFGFDLDDRDAWEEIEVPDTPEARKADFSITIKGDSMEPIYSDGELVLVKSQPTIGIGETGIFIVNGSGFIKQYGGDRLISINSKYDDILFSEGDTVSCAGKVIDHFVPPKR